MDSKQQPSQILFSNPMEPVNVYSETLKPPSRKQNSRLTPFEALVDQTSASDANVDDSYPSDCESGITGTENPDHESHAPVSNGLLKISEGEMIHEVIGKKLISSLSLFGFNARVESIHRNDLSIIMRRAKLQSFCVYSKVIETKCKGSANLKYAWYGSSKNEIDTVLSHGFDLPMDSGVYGQGLYLSPVDNPIESVQSAVGDENGLKHMLLCRVIMGQMEPVPPGSRQCNPSSEEFDSGVDSLASPKKYIVWASKMNTHVLPEFVVSFRTSSTVCKEFQRVPSQKLPRSDWMPFPNLIKVLSKFLPSDAIELISKYHGDFKKQKISRHDMIGLVRNIAGDNLLAAIIKTYKAKIHARVKNSSFRAARNNCTETSE